MVLHACRQVATNAQSPHFATFKRDLRSLPLWHTASSKGELISADNALIVKTPGLLAPWAKDYDLFVDLASANDRLNQPCFQLLGMQVVPTMSVIKNHLLPIPSQMSIANWDSYKTFISGASAFSESSDNLNDLISVLSTEPIAFDGNLSLHRADELYDHRDEIFKCAFREQTATRFLNSAVQDFHPFWLKMGLRHTQNGLLNPADYVLSLQSMIERLGGTNVDSNHRLATDIQTVLSPLIDRNSRRQNFTKNVWRTISQKRVFPSRSNFDNDPLYRRAPMGAVAARRRVLTLSEAISYTHAAICWSQTPFARHEPTAEALSFIEGKGKPSIEMVWRHLDHLADMAQHLQEGHVTDFLSDLHCTYSYLQEHAKSTAHFNLKQKAVWLNINSMEGQRACLTDVKSSWNEIGDLVLSSSYDAGRIKALRPGLLQYERLLRSLGCKSITYPPVSRPIVHHGYSTTASLRALRDRNKMLDITFKTEGRELQAHRLVLAAVSEKCACQWNSKFPVENPITFDKELDGECFLSYHTLSTMIHYAYEDEIDWSQMEVSDDDDDDVRSEKLQLLFDLHRGARFWIIPSLMSQVEDKILVAGKLFINIENVVVIREEAENAGTKAVEQMCAQFIRQNQETVDRVNGSVN